MAKRSGTTLTIRTPHSTIKTSDMTKFAEVFYRETEKRAYSVAFDKMAIATRTAINRWYIVMATFFQRVVSRTPLDEKYINGIDDKGKLIFHIPDKDRCRFDWYIECGPAKVTAEEMILKNPTLFNEYNNSTSIDFIVNFFKNKFGELDFTQCTIGNDNPHFAILEYGGYDHDTAKRQGIPENPWETGEEHGVKNKHSVQAPVGMLRVTQMELESMKKSSAKSALSKRYRGQRTSKQISDVKLNRLIKQFKASKNLPLKDIKRYLDI